jgi:hypothetical protein
MAACSTFSHRPFEVDIEVARPNMFKNQALIIVGVFIALVLVAAILAVVGPFR